MVSSPQVIRASGRLIADPSTPFHLGEYPFGGIEVGALSGCVIVPLGEHVTIVNEFLGEIVEALEPDRHYVMSGFLRGFTDESLRCLFSDRSEQGVSQHYAYHAPGNAFPGSRASRRAVMLAFIPDDPISSRGFVIYRGIVFWSDGAELAFQNDAELGLSIQVVCLRDHSDNILRIGRLADLPFV